MNYLVPRIDLHTTKTNKFAFLYGQIKNKQIKFLYIKW